MWEYIPSFLKSEHDFYEDRARGWSVHLLKAKVLTLPIDRAGFKYLASYSDLILLPCLNCMKEAGEPALAWDCLK